jgi:hypothetical protein
MSKVPKRVPTKFISWSSSEVFVATLSRGEGLAERPVPRISAKSLVKEKTRGTLSHASEGNSS